MDTRTTLGFIAGYFAAIAGVFLLYLPDILLLVALLLADGMLQLLLLPFAILVRRLRHLPEAQVDSAWLLERHR